MKKYQDVIMQMCNQTKGQLHILCNIAGFSLIYEEISLSLKENESNLLIFTFNESN